MLKKYTPEVVNATPEQIHRAALDTVPQVAPLFWAFRIMVGAGFTMLILFVLAVYFTAQRTLTHPNRRWFLWFALCCLPLPWLASEMGWFVAEYGRQPWSIAEILPTHLSVSSRSPWDLYFSLAGFIGFYTLLFIVEIFLMIKYARLGPSSLGTQRYHFEQTEQVAVKG